MKSNLQSFLMTLAAAATAACLIVSVSGGFVYVKNCTDKALCFSGCQTYELPTDQCIPMSNAGSQTISCAPEMKVCGDLTYFTDSACQDVLMSDAFLCGQCNKNNQGQFSTAVCAREGLLESLELSSCTTDCGSCNNALNISRDVCVPFGQQQVDLARQRSPALDESLPQGAPLYAMYRGSRICNAVQVEQWLSGSVTCDSTPSRQLQLPERACIEGTAVYCGF